MASHRWYLTRLSRVPLGERDFVAALFMLIPVASQVAALVHDTQSSSANRRRGGTRKRLHRPVSGQKNGVQPFGDVRLTEFRPEYDSSHDGRVDEQRAPEPSYPPTP